MQRLSRRTFLRTTAASAVGVGLSAGAASILAACGSDDPGEATNGVGRLPDGVQVIQRFPQILVPGDVRMPISLALGGGLLTSGDPSAPSVLTGRLERLDGSDFVPYVAGLRAERHDAELATPYWPFRATIDAPGVYQLLLDGGPGEGAAIQVSPRDAIGVPKVGDLLPALDSPTVLDPRGVDPLCTRSPQPCVLHDVSLRQAVTRGLPVAYLVGTPAHCSTGTCTPALNALLDLHAELSERATFIHAEVYADRAASTPSPAITDFAMTYEPALFITNAEGVVVDRLDAVFDVRELRASLARAGVS
jgi:hypothetical protein